MKSDRCMLHPKLFPGFFNRQKNFGSFFPVWLRNRLISGGLEYHTEKSCIVSKYIQFFTDIK